MTDFVPFEPGTVAVTNGSKNVVGTGTDFTVYAPRDTIFVDGYPMLIDVITDATHFTAKYNHLGPTGSGKAYCWEPVADMSRAIALDTRLSSYFSSGNLSAEAALVGAADRLSYYTGVATKAITPLTAFGRSLIDDADAAAGLLTLGAIGGTLGATANRVGVASGTGGKTLQATAVSIDPSTAVVAGITSQTIQGAGTTTVGYANGDAVGGALIVRDTGAAANNGGEILFGANQGLFAQIKGALVNGTGPAGRVWLGTRGTSGDIVAWFGIDEAGIARINGGILRFPATQIPSAGANDNDDYEEGGWTDGLTFGGTSVGMTFHANNGGRYTKNGRNVNLSETRLALTAKGSSTGTALGTGLPFTGGGNGSGHATVLAGFASLTGGIEPSFGATATMGLRTPTATATTQLTDAHFTNTSDFMPAGAYAV